MALTHSETLAPDTPAPDFDLPDANPLVGGSDSGRRSLADFKDAKALVVVFTCNHCPYAIHVEDALITLAKDLQPKGARFVAISSNDPDSHPQDGFEAMARRARDKAFPFPYLFDEDQTVALAYGARCTPDPYVFDGEGRLKYHGRVDATRPRQGVSDGAELRAAIEAVLQGEPVPGHQVLSIGCNIKWKPGNAPA